jgi:uncharacterized delta-60 repeat protein
MVRYNANGSLDDTFDGDGIVIVPGPGNAITDSLALQPDGKIVVAHNVFFSNSFSYGLTVLRYNANGSPDMSFNNTGSLSTVVGTNVEFAALALQPDGKIVVACSSYTSNAPVTTSGSYVIPPMEVSTSLSEIKDSSLRRSEPVPHSMFQGGRDPGKRKDSRGRNKPERFQQRFCDRPLQQKRFA